jgi:apolipoprotein N-acyltransferase
MTRPPPRRAVNDAPPLDFQLPARLALIAVSAALYAAAFPPLALRWLAWIALTPLLVALRGASLPRAAALGALWGVLAAEGVGTWFATGVARYYDQPLAVGVLFFAGVALLLASPFFAVFAAAYAWRTRARPRITDALWVPTLWVACELARARFLVGNPWALLGYSQMGTPRLVQIADVTGVYGISFVLAAVSAALACALDPTTPRAARRRAAAVAAGLGALVLAYGTWALDRPLPAGAPLEVAVVQGDLDPGTQWRRDRYGANLETYLRLSQEVLARTRPALVVWPESATTFFLEDEPVYRAAIGHLFASAGAYLITGGPAHDGGESRSGIAAVSAAAGDGDSSAGAARGGPPSASAAPRYFNAAYLLAPNGTILDRYDKVRLLPFSEYFPLAGFKTLSRRFARVREFTPGRALHPLAHAPYPLATVICFEAMYPELVTPLANAGAALLLNLTNDAWMGRTSFARQHLEIAALRAVESRRYLVRAAATGISAVVDPYGRIVTEIPAFERGTAAAQVRLLGGRTLYGRVGDLFALACALGAAAVLARGRRDAGRA